MTKTGVGGNDKREVVKLKKKHRGVYSCIFIKGFKDGERKGRREEREKRRKSEILQPMTYRNASRGRNSKGRGEEIKSRATIYTPEKTSTTNIFFHLIPMKKD